MSAAKRRPSTKVLQSEIEEARKNLALRIKETEQSGERAEEVAADIRRRTPRPSYADSEHLEDVVIPKPSKE